jgi:segregation and condensation protein B
MSDETHTTDAYARAAVSSDLVGAVEALLFVAGVPLPFDDIVAALEGPGPDEVREALVEIARICDRPGRGVELVEVAGGWQFRTRTRFADSIVRLRGLRPAKLSRPALEVLAVIAYRQPVTRHEIEDLRGVDSGGVLKTLLERNLVRVAGRREEPGRPLEYATTPEFLQMFTLPALSALPTLREREELMRDRGDAPTPIVSLDAMATGATPEGAIDVDDAGPVPTDAAAGEE